MENHELLKFVLDTFTELTALHAAAAIAAERVRSVLAKHYEDVSHGVTCNGLHQGCVLQDQLMVDPTDFTMKWNGRCCYLGPTILFKLIQQLARRPGRYFTYDILMETVWERRCSNSTIRSAVKRLRRAMRDAGMPEPANAIKGRRECYGIFLKDSDS